MQQTVGREGGDVGGVGGGRGGGAGAGDVLPDPQHVHVLPRVRVERGREGVQPVPAGVLLPRGDDGSGVPRGDVQRRARCVGGVGMPGVERDGVRGAAVHRVLAELHARPRVPGVQERVRGGGVPTEPVHGGGDDGHDDVPGVPQLPERAVPVAVV